MTEQGQVDADVIDAEWERPALWHELCQARDDIHQWVTLAKRQREELSSVNRLPCGPTLEGVHRSEALLERIDNAMRAAVKSQQIQPPADHVPEAGQVVGENKSQFYRDGNVPMVGDIVQCVDDSHVVADKRSYMRKNGGPLHVVKVGNDSSWVCLSNDVFQDWNCTRFNLIARTRTAPDASPAPPPEPAPGVITGPGLYRTKAIDEGDKNRAWPVEVIGWSEELQSFIGVCNRVPGEWFANGMFRHPYIRGYDITGPYQPAPEPVPVLTLMEAAEALAPWMSAALSDDGCKEFKKAASDFIDAVGRERKEDVQ